MVEEGRLSDLKAAKSSRFSVAKVTSEQRNEIPEDEDRPPTPSEPHYTTQYLSSFNKYTREALPREENYNLEEVHKRRRPSLHRLMAHVEMRQDVKIPVDEDPLSKSGKVIKFGWIDGVYMRCLLNIWGVMLFLRLSWVIGEAGVGCGLLIVVLSNIVTIITGISMSAVCTNGQIKAGGLYYMISRSLGPEFGGSIGLVFTLSNSVACAMYIIGFCESLLDLLRFQGIDKVIVDGGLNDTRIIGTITLVALLCIAFIGMDWVTRTQKLLMVVLLAAQVNFIVGCFMGPQSEEEKAKGMVGFDVETFKENFGYKWKPDKDGLEQNFFTVFAVFFPAVTGIVAGANLSGDLKNPSTAIPRGTLYAIGTTFVSYIIYALFFGATMKRESTGNVADLPLNYTNCAEGDCEWGLYNAQAMTVAAAWDGLIYAGCFAATLSSAIASLVGAPRVLQALASDKLYPYIDFFAVGFGANNDPVRGYILCFFIALACIAIGNVNVVATITTTIFLTAYGLINFSVFHGSIIKSPGWRPSFKYYNAWVSLLGTVLCLIVMFLISWYLALVTFAAVIILYLLVIYLKPNVNWGSSTQAQYYVTALRASLDLLQVEEHVKNYRPQVLVLSGSPTQRPPLVHLGNLITKSISLLIVGHIVKPVMNQEIYNALNKRGYAWLKRQKIRAFYSLVEDSNFGSGAKAFYQVCGMGRLRPNTVLMGFKVNWRICPRKEIKDYFMAIYDALEMHLAVIILRVPEGLDYSSVIEEDEHATDDKSKTNGQAHANEVNQDVPSLDKLKKPDATAKFKANLKKQGRRFSVSNLYQGARGTSLSKDILSGLTRFQRKQGKGFIDVWWLYDDGGLTLLIPYILTTRPQFQSCNLRIFSIANKKDELDREQRNMAALLNKFRIDFSDVIVISEIGKRAEPGSKIEFDELIAPFMAKAKDEDNEDGITEAELLALKEKTNRHIRLRELLMEHSRDSNLIIMTLPMPRKGTVSPALYMAWLETITKNMPPFLIIRGNQTSVLTFYS